MTYQVFDSEKKGVLMGEIKSVKRTLDILDLFITCGPEIGTTEAARRLGLNKSTVSRLMSTMVSRNLLKKNLQTRKYHLHSKIMQLARVYLADIDLKIVASPYLKELSKKTHELILLHIIKDDKRFCLDWIESQYPIRFIPSKDHLSDPLHAGAPGKLLLAYLSEQEVSAIIQRTSLPKYTKNTITNKESLKKELEKIRNAEFAYSDGEHIKYVCTVSAPVRNHLDKVIAALSIAWLDMRNATEKKNKKSKYTALAKETAMRLSNELGYFE